MEPQNLRVAGFGAWEFQGLGPQKSRVWTRKGGGGGVGRGWGKVSGNQTSIHPDFRDPEIQKSSRRIFPPRGAHIYIYIYIIIFTLNLYLENVSTKATQNTPPPIPKAWSILDQAWGRRILRKGRHASSVGEPRFAFSSTKTLEAEEPAWRENGCLFGGTA